MMVSFEYELVTFFASVALALFVGVLCDFFRAVRAQGGPAVLWDIIMWTAVPAVCCFVWFYILCGEIRWYMILGVFLTGVIYRFSVSKFVFFLLKFIIDKICAKFRIFFKILLTPLRFLCKIISVYIGKAKSEFSKKVEEKYDEKKACD